jgi:hypothetical protein
MRRILTIERTRLLELSGAGLLYNLPEFLIMISAIEVPQLRFSSIAGEAKAGCKQGVMVSICLA